MARWMVCLVLGGVACGGQTPRECDAGTPTCESSLLLTFPDDRTRFSLEVLTPAVEGESELWLSIECPQEDTGTSQLDGFTWTCGTGQVTIDSLLAFGETVQIGIGATPPIDYPNDLQRGADFCGNPCNLGRINL